MQDIYQDLISYAARLKSDYGLDISLHQLNHLYDRNKIIGLMTHNNAYCALFKNFKNAYQKCTSCQRALKKLLKPNTMHFGTCPKGVSEYTYPVLHNCEFLALVCLSGYKAQDQQSGRYISKVHHRYDIPKKNLKSAYANLKDTAPSDSEIKALFMPVVRLLQLIYVEECSSAHNAKIPTQTDRIYNLILDYITENLTSDLNMNDIACAINYSPSYLFAVFKQKNTMTLSNYANFLRIERAKSLLLNSDMTVSEIAAILGYYNSSYFSNTFKHLCGVSPRNYRRSNIKQ